MSILRQWWEEVKEWKDAVEDWFESGGQGPSPSPPAPPTPAPGPTPTPTPTPGPPLPPTTGTVAWVNDPSSGISDADVATFVAAANVQHGDIQALWPSVGPWTDVAVPRGQQPPAGAVVMTIVDQLPEAPGALAYHSVDPNGNPFGRVGAVICQQNGVSWQSAASHELWELKVDPQCTVTATDPLTGKVWALETADPTESDSYKVNGVEFSNGVGPAFFRLAGGVQPDQSTGPLDHMGVVTAPFSIRPGGYAIEDNQAVYGENYPEFRKRHVEALGQMGTPRRPR